MKLSDIYKRTYYAILLHKRSGKLLYEHSDVVDFEMYESNWMQWYADPVVFKYKDKEWLFAEKMNMLNRKGTIAVAEINENGVGDFKEVLEEDFHLSYPIVFYKNGNVYMIPESAKQKAIYLYKCIQFPYRWEKRMTLLDGDYYADTNVLNWKNHWYLITGKMDPLIGARTQLQIFDADYIEEGRLNVLNTNQFKYSYNSRGAGNIIIEKDSIIRPTQVGDSQHYGIGMHFYNVSINEKYCEEIINKFGCERIRLNKSVNLTGTHTYSLSDRYEIIDIQYTRLAHPAVIFSTIIRKAWSYLRRIFN